MSALLVSDLRTSFSNFKKDITDVSQYEFIQWCDFLTKFAYRILIKIDPERFITTSTINVSSGTSTYTMPTDLRDITAFGCGIYQLDSTTGAVAFGPLAYTSPGNTAPGYYINNRSIIFTPLPGDAVTYTIRYIPKPPTITAYGDYLTSDKLITGRIILDDEYSWYVQDALDTLYTRWDEDILVENYSDARFENKLNELANTIKITPAAFGTDDFSSIYSI